VEKSINVRNHIRFSQFTILLLSVWSRKDDGFQRKHSSQLQKIHRQRSGRRGAGIREFCDFCPF